MKAQVGIWSPRGETFRGYLPVRNLTFSDELGGGGSISYDALMSDVDALDAWDCTVIILLLSDDETENFWGPAYAMRHEYSHHAGFRWFSFNGVGLLEQWGNEAVLMPEYTVGTMPARAGRERGLGWMSTAYNPATDPDEPWDRIYHDTDHPTMPKGWPTASGAQWVSATGYTSALDRKYFRSWLTIGGTTPRLCEFYLTGDESTALWVAGERVIQTDSVETGWKEFSKIKMVLFPGTYAVGIYTQTVVSAGGSGTDPVMAAGAILDASGAPSSWVMATNASSWKACRRDDVPPNDVPPGPTSGEMLRYLTEEARERRVSGWENVALGFTATHDSYGVAWPAGNIAERLFNYGSDTYYNMFQAWAESDEFDTWLDSGLTLQAAPRQGQAKSLILTEEHFHEFNTRGTPGGGTWTMALAQDGWLYRSAGGIRREFALELGTALTRVVGQKAAAAALRDKWRWDGSGSMNPPKPGWVPYVDLHLGDSMWIDYQAVDRGVSITSFSAKAGEGGLLWDMELTEWPIGSTVEDAPIAAAVDLFEGLP